MKLKLDQKRYNGTSVYLYVCISVYLDIFFKLYVSPLSQIVTLSPDQPSSTFPATTTTRGSSSTTLPTSSPPAQAKGWETFGITIIAIIFVFIVIAIMFGIYYVMKKRRMRELRDPDLSSQINLVPYQNLDSAL